MACLEIWVKGHPRSLKMTPFNRPYTTLYQPTIVTIAISCTIFKLFDIQNIVTLKSRLGATQGHWKWHHSIDHISYNTLLTTEDEQELVCDLSSSSRTHTRRRRQITYEFLFVFCCKYVYLLPLPIQSASNVGMTLKSGIGGGVVKMEQIGRSYTTLYSSAVVNTSLSCTIFELSDVQNIVTLKSRLGVIEGHWKWHHSIDRIRVPIHLPL